MVKKILVPLAFSQYSKGIVTYAAGLAEALGANLLIANIISNRDIEAVERIASYGYKVDTESYIEIIHKERRQQLLDMAAELTLPDERVSYTFKVGDPSTELLKIIVRKEIDMVVMGVKTRDLKNVFTGSVAERIFRKCPVTVVSYRDVDTSERLRKRALKLVEKKHL